MNRFNGIKLLQLQQKNEKEVHLSGRQNNLGWEKNGDTEIKSSSNVIKFQKRNANNWKTLSCYRKTEILFLSKARKSFQNISGKSTWKGFRGRFQHNWSLYWGKAVQGWKLLSIFHSFFFLSFALICVIQSINYLQNGCLKTFVGVSKYEKFAFNSMKAFH